MICVNQIYKSLCSGPRGFMDSSKNRIPLKPVTGGEVSDVKMPTLAVMISIVAS